MPDGTLAARALRMADVARARDADQRAANRAKAPGFAARIDELRAVFGADCRVFALDTEGGSTLPAVQEWSRKRGGLGVVVQASAPRKPGKLLKETR